MTSSTGKENLMDGVLGCGWRHFSASWWKPHQHANTPPPQARLTWGTATGIAQGGDKVSWVPVFPITSWRGWG